MNNDHLFNCRNLAINTINLHVLLDDMQIFTSNNQAQWTHDCRVDFSNDKSHVVDSFSVNHMRALAKKAQKA